MLAVYRRQEPDRIPFAAYDWLVPQGHIEKQLRNQGMGLIRWYPVASLISPSFLGWTTRSENVIVSIKEVRENGVNLIVRAFETPVGTVTEKYRTDPGYGSKWIIKHLIESIPEYEIVQYIVENTVIEDNSEKALELQDNLGEDGVIVALMDRTPFQKVLWEFTGPQRLILDLYDKPDVVENLIRAVEKKTEETYSIVADSPIELIWSPDNITGDITSPNLFKKYCVPHYERVSRLLHEKGKVLVVHMDGRLKPLAGMIKELDIDMVESLSFPLVGGDTSLREAVAAWPDKSIAANVPASLCFQEEGVIRNYMSQMLLELGSKKDFMLLVSEDLPHQYWRRTLPVISDSLWSFNRG
jgi:hypothetical protein